MPEEITTQELEKASRNLERMSQFVGERRGWLLGTGGEAAAQHARETAASLAEGIAELTDGRIGPLSSVQQPPEMEPSAKISGNRLSKFADFMEDLRKWFASHGDGGLPPEHDDIVQSMQASLAVTSEALQILLGPAALETTSKKESTAAAEELPSAPTKEKSAPTKGKPATAKGKPATAKGKPATAKGKPATTKGKPATTKGKPATAKEKPATAEALEPEAADEPEALTSGDLGPVAEVDADARLILENTDLRPLLQEFKGVRELTVLTKEKLHSFLAKQGIEFGKNETRRLHDKVLRWIEGTPAGRVLVIKISGLYGKPEAYSSYQPKETVIPDPTEAD